MRIAITWINHTPTGPLSAEYPQSEISRYFPERTGIPFPWTGPRPGNLPEGDATGLIPVGNGPWLLPDPSRAAEDEAADEPSP